MLTVHMIVNAADSASDWYCNVLGFTEESRIELPDGRLINVVLRSPSAALTLADEFPEHGAVSPTSPESTPIVLYLQVPDVDQVWDRALAAGAQVRRQLADAFWGKREGQFVDPFGHVWGVSTHVRDVSQAELSELAAAAFARPGQA
jgi:PhnB protein